jgi:hypothetical protein
MRYILNVILTGVVLFLAAHFFPNDIYIADTQTLVYASLLLGVAKVLVIIVVLLALVGSISSGDITGAFSSIVAAMFVEFYAISLVEDWLPGFSTSGIITEAVLAFAISLFTIPGLARDY